MTSRRNDFAVIFDMDGLLIDSEPLWKKAEIEVFSTVGIDLTEQGCEETVGWRIDQVVDLWHDRHPWDHKSKDTVMDEILECMCHLISNEGTALPGAQRLVYELDEARVKNALATSSHPRIIDAVMQRLEFNFPVVHSAFQEDWGKPHPAVFTSTATRLEVSPQRCVVFEDSINGVIAGRAGGMKVVAVPQSNYLERPEFSIAHRVIGSLEEADLAFITQVVEQRPVIA